MQGDNRETHAATDLAEIHRLDTLATKRGTDGRAGTGLAGSHNQLDNGVDTGCCALCFRHGWSGFTGGGMLAFWAKRNIVSCSRGEFFVNLEATRICR